MQKKLDNDKESRSNAGEADEVASNYESHRRKRCENTVYVHDHLIHWDVVQGQKYPQASRGRSSSNNIKNSNCSRNSKLSCSKSNYMQHTLSSKSKIRQ